ncbi:MAG TPA: hypothetical protein VMU86_07100, partial [Steroidobacteraceae bacterium]|nr:hypothetical protein [Steroidobacteraceae bacterium]
MSAQLALALSTAIVVGAVGAVGAANRADRTLHSDANVGAFQVTRIALSLDADFTWQQLRGTAVLTVRRLDPRADQLILDTRGLRIFAVDELSHATFGATEKLAPFWVSRPFRLGVPDPVDGTPLIIDMPRSDVADVSLRIEYQTAPRAPGLNWTTARAGGGGPRIFYAVSEPFGARSWIPLQDTPRAHTTVVLHLHTPSDMVVLLSGATGPPQHHEESISKRAADHWLWTAGPMQPSQLDLVVGDLKFAAIDARSGVFAVGWSARGPARVLRDYPAVRRAGDRLLGLRAGAPRDFVVMPDGFPYRSLAAPGLTLLSPTLLERVPHRVPLAARLPFAAAAAAVLPAGRGDGWIGQAFAAYAESRITASLYGEQDAAVLDTLAYLELQHSLAASPRRELVLDRARPARAPIAGVGTLRAEKGRLLFEYLAASIGRQRFDELARDWYARFAGQAVTTELFARFLARRLNDVAPGAVRRDRLEDWLRNPGLPSAAVLPEAGTLRAIDDARNAWLAGRMTAAGMKARRWPAEDWCYFLEGLP